ncbi:MAG TPA: UDP-3-O-(3-hydroxymyristoyl)glucosamine N-acyltransferase [Candidatus Acidoferrales bacterium]|nr:UDP-3-O-(3-hydroxymyristoyl)glucosamine N-acyltransferase [Candidatus Acidoferrales bacterium]
MRLAEIARRLGCKLEGDPTVEITGVAGVGEAQAGELTFLANPRYRAAVRTTRASAIVVGTGAGPVPLAALRSANPYYDFARAIELFHAPAAYKPGVHPTAVVAASARIGSGAHIGPYCFVDEGVQIGNNAVLHSFVAIYRGASIGNDFFAHSHTVVREGCRLGDRVILQNGAVVGSDGFGFARTVEGRWHKMRQAGSAAIEDDVEIQANSCVDRATIGVTRIGRGAKLDNLVQVGHSSRVGQDTLLCGQVGLAGSTTVGSRAILAGQVGVAGHLTIGDGAVLTAKSGVPSDVPAGSIYSGYPAIENKRWLKCVAEFNRLPELHRAMRALEHRLAAIERQAARTRRSVKPKASARSRPSKR